MPAIRSFVLRARRAGAVIVRLWLGASLASLAVLSLALCSSYLMGGAAPATILYGFLRAAGAAQPVAAVAAGAVIAALCLCAPRRLVRAPQRAPSPQGRHASASAPRRLF